MTDANEGFEDRPGVPEPILVLCSAALFLVVALSLGRKFDNRRTSVSIVSITSASIVRYICKHVRCITLIFFSREIVTFDFIFIYLFILI